MSAGRWASGPPGKPGPRAGTGSLVGGATGLVGGKASVGPRDRQLARGDPARWVYPIVAGPRSPGPCGRSLTARHPAEHDAAGARAMAGADRRERPRVLPRDAGVAGGGGEGARGALLAARRR